jgi:putative acetyltransferase
MGEVEMIPRSWAEEPQVDGLCLRRLSGGDMEAAAGVHRRSFDARLPWLAGLHAEEEDMAYWTEQLLPTCLIWGCFDADWLTGVIAFRQGWVEQLYVLPEAQRLKIGTRLLDLAKAASPELRLWTFRCNHPARAFYRSHGFVETRETDGSGNEEQEPDVLCHWRRSG